MSLDELAAKMKTSPISLFYGAGVSFACGGPLGDELAALIQRNFSVQTKKDFFSLMQEVIGWNDDNRAEAEALIRKRLAAISPKEDQKYLFSIPWKAILTTNYDQLPDIIGSTLDGSRQVIPIADPEREVNQLRDDHLYCFKLLGDSQYSFSQGGWMVLSTSDLFSESERRTTFFRKFRTLAISGHIIYLGYSFEDDLVFLLLNHMKKVLQTFPWKGFAIIPDEPDSETKKKLESVGITWVKGTLEDFVKSAKKVFGDTPKSAPVDVGCLTLHGQTVDIDRSVFSNIKGKFSLLHEDLMKSSSEKIEDFLQGTCKTFFPYVWNWDFRRESKVIWEKPNAKAIIPNDLALLSNRTSVVDLDQNFFCALVGIAGSGKSIFVNRIAFEWHQTGNPVIFVDPTNSSIDTPALDGVMNEIRENYMKRAKEAGVTNPKSLKWLLITDGCAPIIGQIKILRDHLLSTGKPGDIILVSRESEAPLEKIKTYGFDAIYKLSDTIYEEDRDRFLQQSKRFGIIDEEIFNKNIRDPEVNSSFFALIYSTLHSSRKAINKLLKEEYEKLDQESKKTYQTVSLIQAYQLDPLVTLVTKSQSIDPNWLRPQLATGSLSGVLRTANYGRSLFAFQRIVAESIAEAIFRTSDERKSALKSIIGAVTYGEESEMHLLENLLNFRIDLDVGPRLTPDNKIDLYRQAVEIVKSKPLLIHLGRLQTNAHRFEDARKTLKEAYGAYVQGFDEREEHVRDAEGRLEHAIAEDEMAKGENCRKDVAWEHLEEAEKKFNEAKIDPRLTPYPYTGLARTYLAKARLVPEENLQWDLILAAAQECNFLDRSIGESYDSYVVKKEVGNLLDKLGFNERHIERMLSPLGKANGYAYLTEIKVAHGEEKEALEFVEKGLKFDGMSIWLMRLRIYLLRRLNPSDHKTIRNTLDDYAAISGTKYDVELSFELAKETYIEGKIREARLLFKELGRRAENHPRKLIPREQEDRWIEAGNAKRLTGTIVRLPIGDSYGRIQTTFPQPYGDSLIVRKPDLQYANPQVGDRVNYEIVFNMLGPEVSRVRRL
jgi:hypothetical protein